MPPPPGQSSTSVLFLRKQNYKDALDRPLAETLRLAAPPLPTEADSAEGTTIDELTLPSLFSYELTALQRLFLFTRSDTIYAGSNQIQRNLIAGLMGLKVM